MRAHPHQVCFVEDDAVSIGHLSNGLIHNAFLLFLVQVLPHMLGVHQRQHTIQAVVLRNRLQAHAMW